MIMIEASFSGGLGFYKVSFLRFSMYLSILWSCLGMSIL